MIKDCDHVVAEAEARMDAYRKRVVVLEAENKELRAALEPFAKFGDVPELAHSDTYPLLSFPEATVRVGDFRKARAALAAK